MTTDQKVTGLNPVGVTSLKPIENQAIKADFSRFFLCILRAWTHKMMSKKVKKSKNTARFCVVGVQVDLQVCKPHKQKTLWQQ